MLFYCHTHCAGEPPKNAGSNLLESSHSETQLVHNTSSASKMALLALFAKYGRNGSLSFEGFEHLLANLGLGKTAVSDHNVSEHRESKGTWSVTLATNDHRHHSDHHEHHDDELDGENHDKVHQERAANMSDECPRCLSSVVNSPFFKFTTAVVTSKQVITVFSIRHKQDLCNTEMLQLLYPVWKNPPPSSSWDCPSVSYFFVCRSQIFKQIQVLGYVQTWGFCLRKAAGYQVPYTWVSVNFSQCNSGVSGRLHSWLVVFVPL